MLSLRAATTQPSESLFNCPEQCGLYPANNVGEKLHDECTAIDESVKCRDNFVEKRKKRKRKKRIHKECSSRMLGTPPPQLALPWMVMSCVNKFKDETKKLSGDDYSGPRGVHWDTYKFSVCLDSSTLLL